MPAETAATAAAVAIPSTGLLWLAGYVGEVPAGVLITVSGAIAGGVWALMAEKPRVDDRPVWDGFLRATLYALAPVLPASMLTGVGALVASWAIGHVDGLNMHPDVLLPGVACALARVIRRPSDLARFVDWGLSVWRRRKE